MVTLQGVIILRITDFRRFFDTYEFETKKADFLSLFHEEIQRHVGCDKDALHSKHFFVDTNEEYFLLQNLCHWLNKPEDELTNIELDTTELKIKTEFGETMKYPLEEKLRTAIQEKKEELTKKTKVGYTLLYLLLNADSKNANSIDYTFGNNTISSKIREFNYCNSNIVLEKIKIEQFQEPLRLRRCTFVNVAEQHIIIKLDKKDIQLAPNECVIGIFCGNKCYKLLPNNLEATSNHTKTSLKLFYKDNKITLEMHRPVNSRSIADVISIGFDGYGHPIYMTRNGNIINPDQAPMIDLSIQHLRQYSNAIAFELNGGHITLYTTDRIIG